MRWYADNSELNGIRGSAIPDILLFGGVAISADQARPMREAIEAVKARYGPPRAPVKWNFKDLYHLYKKQGIENVYNDLLKTSKAWRLDMAVAVEKFDFRIILAVVEGHSIAKKTLKGVRPNLCRYAFNNGLMRFALHVQESCTGPSQVILDWPDRGDSKPFDLEYRTAYNEGKTGERNQTYMSGPLSLLGFEDCVSFVNMHHSTLLQFADLAIGANRELIECALGKKASGLGVDFCKELKSKYRGYPDNIVGRGVSIASASSDFRHAVRLFVNRELAP